MHDELVEVVVVRLVVHVQVVVEFGGLHQRPDLRPYGRRLRRVQVADQCVLVEQLLQLGQVAVGVRAGHRRHQMVDDRRVPAPLGLGALAGVVHDERVDQRQVAQHRVRRASGAQPEALAGQPPIVPCLPMCTTASAPKPPRMSQPPASGRRPGSGARAACRGRGRSRWGSRRSHAAAGSSRRRSRTGGTPARCRPRRRTASPAAHPTPPSSPPAAPDRASRTRPGSRPAAPARARAASCSSVSHSTSCPAKRRSAGGSVRRPRPGAPRPRTRRPAARPGRVPPTRACPAPPRCRRASASSGTR